MEEAKFVVYEHVNKLNGKKYIGITSMIPLERWGKNGRCYSESTIFKRAILKYGWDSFEHNILMEGLTAKEAATLETSLIKYYKSLNMSYNMVEDETYIGKIRSINIDVYTLDGKLIGEFESIQLVATKLKLTPSNINNALNNNHNCFLIKGYIFVRHGESPLNKINLAILKGRPFRKKIAQYDLNGTLIKIYNSMKELVELTGFKRSSILNCLTTLKYKNALGYIWKYV